MGLILNPYSMLLTKEEIEEFQQIWKAEFGEELPWKEAHRRAIEVMTLFRTILRPIPSDQNNGNDPDSDKADRLAVRTQKRRRKAKRKPAH